MTAPPRTRPTPVRTPPAREQAPPPAAPHVPVQRGRPFLRRLVEVLPPPAVDPPALRPPPAHRGDPDAARAADRVLRVAVEVVAGRRPVSQLEPVLAPSVRSRLRWLHRTAGHLRVRVLTVRCQQPTPGVLEAVAVVETCNGARALAARFQQVVDGTGDRWACTALDLKLTAGDQCARRRAAGSARRPTR